MAGAAVHNEKAHAIRWLILAGIAAAALTITLCNVDHYLTTSDSEQVKGREIGRLRTAQSTLPSRSSDRRQLVTSKSGQ